MKRSVGVLMHISSLFGDYSIGSFGEEARYFIDFLADCGFSYWQTLPFNMTDECGSPYKSFGAFSGNPFLIDLPTLFRKGLITIEELDESRQRTPYICEFEKLAAERYALLFKAADRLRDHSDVDRFIDENPHIASFCRFMALKESNGGKPWNEWSTETIDKDALFRWQFIEYEFFSEWQNIKKYANDKNIRIIGDIPIYVAYDSSDVWANREEFQLDKEGHLLNVAGVPPDYFSEEGQLWGNPLYDWEKMKDGNYRWWRDRMTHTLRMFDGVRIDHFRGLESYWSIPADAKSAKEGKWVKGPGRDFIDCLRDVARGKMIIAEDLGDITAEVADLVKYSGFPGMRVLQFAFLGDPSSPHLPHNYISNCVAYTGTHDNNTLLGYIWEMPADTRKRVIDYCGFERVDWNDLCDELTREMLASHAGLVMLPIQDVFRYGSDTRMNIPGKPEGNWRYRMTKEQLDSVDRAKFRYRNELFGRI